MKNKKSIIALILVVLTFGICTAGCSNQDEIYQQEEPVTILNNLNHFTAQTLDGGTFSQENFADKDVTVINFWSLMCSPCIAEMPDLAKFQQSLPDNVQLITICLDGSSAPEEAKQILDQAGFTGTTLISGDGDFAMLAQNIMAVPTTIFVDNAGNLVGSSIVGGQENLAEIYTAAINSALKSLGKEEITIEKK